MKNLVIAFLFNAIFTNAQNTLIIPTDNNNKICYEGIFEFSNSSKEMLFNRVKGFFYSKNQSANLQTINGDINKIFFYGSYAAKRNKLKSKEELSYVIKLYIIDNKIKYQMTDFVFHGVSGSNFTRTYYGGGVATTYANSAKQYQYNLEKFYTPKRLAKKDNMFIDIDRINRIIINEMTREFNENEMENTSSIFTNEASNQAIKKQEYSILEEQGLKDLENKNYKECIENFNKILELSPNNSNAYFQRARAKSRLGDFNGSILDNNKTIELEPNFSMAYNNRGWDNFLLKNYIEALKDFNKAIELDPKNSIAYDSRQETKFGLNDYIGCLEDCNIAISLNPKLANSYFFRGKVYFKNGDKVKACENWSKAGQYGAMEAYELIKQNCN